MAQAGGMIGLLCFVLAVLAWPFKSKLRLEASEVSQPRYNKRPPEGGLVRNHLNWRSYLKTDGVDVDVERQPASRIVATASVVGDGGV